MKSFSHVRLFATTRLLQPRDFPGKNSGVGCHFLLQIFLTQGLKPSLLRLLHLTTEPSGKPPRVPQTPPSAGEGAKRPQMRFPLSGDDITSAEPSSCKVLRLKWLDSGAGNTPAIEIEAALALRTPDRNPDAGCPPPAPASGKAAGSLYLCRGS